MNTNVDKTVLVTGGAGFIAFHVISKLCAEGRSVIGIDNFSDDYDVSMKHWRIRMLSKRWPRFVFHKGDIRESATLDSLFHRWPIKTVIHLAARAGIHESLQNPFAFIDTNTVGTLHILERCRHLHIPKLVLASTSGVYPSSSQPLCESTPANMPLTPYAASKCCAEALAYVYHRQYGLDVSVLRFFTAYGPAGRPDMSIFRFIAWALRDKPLIVYGDGQQSRDFTYVVDIADGIVRAARPLGYEIFNLGSGTMVSLNSLIALLERIFGRKLERRHQKTCADEIRESLALNAKAFSTLGWAPDTSLEEGLGRTIAWTRDHFDLINALTLSPSTCAQER